MPSFTSAAPPRQATAKPAALYFAGSTVPLPVEETTTAPVEIDGQIYQRWQVPRYNAGHHQDTPAFGQPGNTIIVGHSIWYGEDGIFRPLLDLQVGDLIRAENDDGTVYTYQVTHRWASTYEDNSWLIQPSDPNENQITLYTCNLSLTALEVVQAELVATTEPTL
jgi:LPXTG-site transpeptidase (sortase) family protein